MNISPLPVLGPDAVDAVHAIYGEAFPPKEQIPFADLVRPPAGEDRDVYVLTESTDVYGFASVFALQGFPALFLEYLAVRRSCRSGGLGSLLWHHIRETAAARSVSGVVLEVEDPDQTGIDPAEAELRRRRIRFYERGGARTLPVSGYRVPSRLEESDLPLRILWVPVGGTPPLSATRLRQLVTTLYAESYGVADTAPAPRRVVVSDEAGAPQGDDAV